MKLTTTVYKYKPYAPLMVVLIAIATLIFFFTPLGIPGIPLIFLIAIVAAIWPRSIFSLRSTDDRKLVFTPDELIWGNLIMPIGEIEKLEIYIHAFESFKYYGSRTGRGGKQVSEYGDRNKIEFIYRGISYDMTFFLGDFDHYDTLVRIIQHWRDQGIDLSARSAFSDSFIRNQRKLYGKTLN